MNYIYDILLNFNKEYYEFFEWNNNDNIINIKKIPIIKIKDNDYINLKYNDVKVSEEFLKMIENLTIVYLGAKNKYMCIVTNEKESIGLSFNKNGNIIKKSSLIIDEEDEVLELAFDLDFFNIEYEVIEKKDNRDFTNRFEKEKKKELIDNINNIYNSNNLLLMKYIYYDYFEKEESDIDIIKDKLLDSINSNWDNSQYRLSKLVNMIVNK